MKASIIHVSAALIALASLATCDVARGGDLARLSNCAWPVMQSPEGLGNYLGGPDDQARYWLTPFDAREWLKSDRCEVVIEQLRRQDDEVRPHSSLGQLTPV